LTEEMGRRNIWGSKKTTIDDLLLIVEEKTEFRVNNQWKIVNGNWVFEDVYSYGYLAEKNSFYSKHTAYWFFYSRMRGAGQEQ